MSMPLVVARLRSSSHTNIPSVRAALSSLNKPIFCPSFLLEHGGLHQRMTSCGTSSPAPSAVSSGPAAKPEDPIVSSGPAAKPEDPIVQYIVVRRDLWEQQGWPLGPLIAQACHASVAALWLHREDEVAQAYVSVDRLDHMHKVVLEVKGETQLKNLAQKLTDGGVAHKVWVEQPEEFPTALATKPYPKSAVVQYFKKLQLCKAKLS